MFLSSKPRLRIKSLRPVGGDNDWFAYPPQSDGSLLTGGKARYIRVANTQVPQLPIGSHFCFLSSKPVDSHQVLRPRRNVWFAFATLKIEMLEFQAESVQIMKRSGVTPVRKFFRTTHPPQAVPLPSQGKALSPPQFPAKPCNLQDFML